MRVAKYAGLAVVLLLVLIVALPFLVNANQFRPTLESSLSRSLGRQVTVGNLSASILSGGLTADDLSVADDPAFSRTAFLHAKSLHVGVELWPLLFSHQLNVTGLTIEQPEIALLQNAAGDWNFSTLGVTSKAAPAGKPAPASASPEITAKLVKISNGRFSMSQLRAKPLVLENVNLQVSDFSASSVFPFSFAAKVVGGGQVNLDGKAGPLEAADVIRTPVDATLKLAQLDLASSGLVAPATGIAGLVSFDGSGQSNGRALQVNGRLTAEKLRLVKAGSPATRPLTFEFAAQHDLDKRSWELRRGDVHFGSAPATLTGTYTLQPESAVLNLLFSGPNMAVPELEAFLPAMDFVLPMGSSLQGGTASARLTMAGPIDRLVTSGSVGLSNTRLAGFNMGAKMAAIETLAGIQGGPNTDIQSLSANVRFAPEGSTIDNLQLVVPSIGNLTGGGTVSPSHALDFKMRATLHTSGNIMAALGQKGDTGVPFLITGTSSDPVFRPDVKSIAEQKIQQFTGNKGELGKTVGGLLNGILGGKKKN